MGIHVIIVAELIEIKKPAGNAMHRNLMRIFRLYMLVGGMPQAIETYIEKNNLQLVDETKREIVDLMVISKNFDLSSLNRKYTQ